jgi:DNA-binding CsgD family transcriptional regulator
VLARLSVFAGAFGLAAAETVAASQDVTPDDVLGHLGALVDKSLVQFGDTSAGPGRYRLLDTVRRYAAWQMDELGAKVADRVRTAHRDYYLALAEMAAPQLVGPDQTEWLDRLDAELGNLRAAIAFSMSHPDPEPGLRLACSLRSYWKIRGYAAEGASVLRALLDAPTTEPTPLLRARALAAAARLLDQMDTYAIAESYCQEALALARAAADDGLVADLLQWQAWILLRQGLSGTALPLIEQGLDLARRLDQPQLTGRLLADRAFARAAEGDQAGAASDTAEALRLFRRAGDRLQVGSILSNLGNHELAAGDLEAARRHLAEALDIARTFKARDGIVYATFNLGLASYLTGSPDEAQALFAESLDLARRLGMKALMAYALIGLALAGAGAADPSRSVRLHGAADQTLTDLGYALEPLEARLTDDDRQRLRAAMGTEAFEAEYAAGRTLGLPGMLAELEHEDAAARQARVLVPAEAPSVLTPRELHVLKLVAQGLSNSDIAQQLVLSEHTVHRHLSNILRKLDLSSRAAAAAWGVRAGLV